MKMKRLVFVIFCWQQFIVAEAQDVLNVASQKFEKKVDYRTGDVLLLQLEKANLTLSGWDKDHFHFEILLKSKHKSRAKAIEELAFLKYSLSKEGDTARFYNFFGASDKFQKVQGILGLDLIIHAPKSSKLVVKNAYGTTRVQEMEGGTSIYGKFVETEVNHFRGPLSMTSIFGSVHLTDHEGDLLLDLSRADLTAKNVRGDIVGKTSYGKVSIASITADQVIFDSKRTAFELDVTQTLNKINFDLSTQFGKIEIGTPINATASGSWKFDGTSAATIKITTTFSPIIIQGKSFNAQKP